MFCTESERLIMIRQLGKARDEAIRAQLMGKGGLADVVATLDGLIVSIVKAEEVDDADDP
jgi:hypothetical protein